MAVKGIQLRKFGQEIIKALGGKKIHPAFAIPGGVTNTLSEKDRNTLLGGFKEAFKTAQTGIDLIKDWTNKNLDEVKKYANFPSNYAGLMDDQGAPNMYDGKFRIVNHEKQIIAQFDPSEYLQFIG
ncbi:MAG: hypothetical protein MUP22_05015, partial [Desulfobacterales bacterium]|nr:hypothetical protein [Desulfobacterales bacterium]